MEVIKISNLVKIYKGSKRKAIDGLNLSIKKGEIFGFLGPNGAGKTTTIKLLLGFLNPTKGKISVLGYPPYTFEAREKIGYLPETADYYWFLTPRKILKFYGICSNLSGKKLEKRIDELLELVKLKEFENELIKNFSKGMKQRVGIAQSLINNPELLIFDEPASGLDPIGRREIRELIKTCASQGKTIFFSSHELGEVENICTRIGIIYRGKLLFEGDLDTLKVKQKQHIEIKIKVDETVFMKRINKKFAKEILKVEKVGQNLFIIELKERKEIYNLMDYLKAANAKILNISDKKGEVEEIFFEVIKEAVEK